MYWQEVPVQVQGVDAISMVDGSSGTHAYLEAWEWGEYRDVEGSAEEAVSALAERLNEGFPRDFVARVRDPHLSGERDPRPGAVDHWTE